MLYSEGEDLDAQLWTPVLLPNIGNDACMLLNKLSNTLACVENTGFLKFGLGKKNPSTKINEYLIFFPKNTGDNIGNIMQGLIEMELKKYDNCIIGWKNAMNQKSLLGAVSSGEPVQVVMGIKEFSLDALEAYQEEIPMKFSGLWQFEYFM